jgi:hypothetical protein
MALQEQRHERVIAQGHEQLLSEVQDLKTEIHQLRTTNEKLEFDIRILEQERDDLKNVVFEEAIVSVKNSRMGPAANRNKPKFVMEYLKRIGYVVPEE